MREEFEEWFSDYGDSPKAIERRGGGYKLMAAQSAWVAWQAAFTYLARMFEYPDCWDTAAYPTIESALDEVHAWFESKDISPEARIDKAKL